jgi:hypothetical protein
MFHKISRIPSAFTDIFPQTAKTNFRTVETHWMEKNPGNVFKLFFEDLEALVLWKGARCCKIFLPDFSSKTLFLAFYAGTAAWPAENKYWLSSRNSKDEQDSEPAFLGACRGLVLAYFTSRRPLQCTSAPDRLVVARGGDAQERSFHGI